MVVFIQWRRLETPKNGDWTRLPEKNGWNQTRCLYYYAMNGEIVYIGKSAGANDFTSVKDRYLAKDKKKVFDKLNVENPDVEIEVYIGEFEMSHDERLTIQRVSDYESILIFALKPPGNSDNKKTRGLYSRPGRLLVCNGKWLSDWLQFTDNGDGSVDRIDKHGRSQTIC